jgi:hypothetical protein
MSLLLCVFDTNATLLHFAHDRLIYAVNDVSFLFRIGIIYETRVSYLAMDQVK